MPTPLGERIRRLREERELTLEGLATRVRSSKSYMWELENKDVARPSAEKLQSIAEALQTTVEFLLQGDDVAEHNATDAAFYRSYRRLEEPQKAQLRRILDALEDD